MRPSVPINQLTRASEVSDTDLIALYSQGNQALRSVAISKFLTDLGLRKGGKEYKQLVTVNSSQILTSLDDISYMLADASGAPLSITLPSAVGRGGDWISIKKQDGTGNEVLILTSLSETIDGDASLSLSGFNRPSAQVISDGANWWVFNA